MCQHCCERPDLPGHAGHRTCCFCKMDLGPAQEMPYHESPLERIHQLEEQLRESNRLVGRLQIVVDAVVKRHKIWLAEEKGDFWQADAAAKVAISKYIGESESAAVRQETEKRFCVTCGKNPVSEAGRTCVPCIAEMYPDSQRAKDSGKSEPCAYCGKSDSSVVPTCHECYMTI